LALSKKTARVARNMDCWTHSTVENRMRRYAFSLIAAGVVGMGGCGVADETAEAVVEEMKEIVLGPVDGHDLLGVDLERVQAGDMAPDFSANTLAGPVATLSSFRGEKNVVLFFYRGHW
jgi:hypothetical protein